MKEEITMDVKAMEQTKPKFAVLGAGHGGMAMAGHLGIMGFDVRMYNRTEEQRRRLSPGGAFFFR